jgi:hypothetical protein
MVVSPSRRLSVHLGVFFADYCDEGLLFDRSIARIAAVFADVVVDDADDAAKPVCSRQIVCRDE